MQSLLDDLGRVSKLLRQPSEIAEQLLKNGWYPVRLISRVQKDPNETIDSYMERILTGRFYEQIKEYYCYQQYPKRKPILEEAFLLFEQERYAACIPLFLMQIDGIAGEFDTVEAMFTGGGPNKKPRFMPHTIKLINNELPEIKKAIQLLFGENFLHIDNVEKKRLTMLISTKDIGVTPLEINFLNRHAIMHGHCEYLDYGTRLNALKVISLLLFTINLISVINDLSFKAKM